MLKRCTIDFSKLKKSEKKALIRLLEPIAYSGLKYEDSSSLCEFFIDEVLDTSHLEIPEHSFLYLHL